MHRFVASVILAVFFSLLAPAGRSQERPLEELRELARSKTEELKKDFESDLLEATKVLSEVDPQNDSKKAVEKRKKLVTWCPTFPERLVAVYNGATNPFLRSHLASVLVLAKDARMAEPLLAILGSRGGDLDVAVVDLLAKLGSTETGPKLATMLKDGRDVPPPLRGAILCALAALKSPEAAALAREGVGHSSPEVRLKALRALAETQASPKEDAAMVIKATQEEKDPAALLEAIRVLGRYPHRDEVLRVLHGFLGSDDASIILAALDAMEMKDVASKETSNKYLFELVQSTATISLRERAARLMAARLGDVRGARAIAKPARDAAEKAPKDASAQTIAGDTFKKLGAYEDAINYYKRAEQLLGVAFKIDVRVSRARCQALLGRFDKARECLQDYKNLSVFADEPDFKEMKADPRYKALFESDSNGK